jgi:quercetin dioxygenase-like cupin family protein
MTPQGRETIRVGRLGIRYLVEGGDSNGSAAVFELDVPAGAGLALPHSHESWEETVYGLEGSVTWTVAGEDLEIGPGGVVCIPRGMVHAFANRGLDDARQLCLITPGVLGPDFFRQVAELVAASDGPPDRAAMGEIMRRHGLRPVAPA